jgi:cysteine synthase A
MTTATPANSLTDLIGNTPLVRLRRASEETGCTILGKCEFMNPGGSIKDRAAKYIILDAEDRGDLAPGGVVVEGTAGNTGIGLALVARARGYRTVITMPETQAREKMDALRLLGAQLHTVPAVPFADPGHYVHAAERLARELAATETAGVLYADQWDNLSNADGHYRSTGPEIWQQANGRVDGFVSAIGTGGTIAGISRYLKERHAGVVVALADPLGASMYHWYKDGELRRTEGSSITEGIGQGRITANIAQAQVDDAFLVSDEEALAVVFGLLAEEGLCVGSSSGINVAGAIRLARAMGPGHTIVTLLCDAGQRYQSKLFNPEFLRSKGLPVPGWLA